MTTHRTRRLTATLGATLVAAFLLAGCTTPSEPETLPTAAAPTATPTPTPTTAPQPRTESDAIRAAYETAQEFFDAWYAVSAEEDGARERLESVADGQALQIANDAIQGVDDLGYNVSGTVEFTLLDGQSYVAPVRDEEGNDVVEYGQPVLEGCLNYSGLTATDEAGETVEVRSPLKYEVIVTYSVETETWIVVRANSDQGSTECDG